MTTARLQIRPGDHTNHARLDRLEELKQEGYLSEVEVSLVGKQARPQFELQHRNGQGLVDWHTSLDGSQVDLFLRGVYIGRDKEGTT